MKEVFYGFTEESLSPFKAFSESVQPVLETEILQLSSPIEVKGSKYGYQLTIDVKVNDLGLDRATHIYNALELLIIASGFEYIPGSDLTSYYQRIKEERTDVVNGFAEGERLLA